MSVRLAGDAIVLEGLCGVEEAEPLWSQLEAHPGLAVDIGSAETLHTALWQLLLMVRPKIVGEPSSAFARDHLLPVLLAKK